MGRVKLQIKRLENTNSRQATYTKRKHGIMKKAHELSVLCDIEVMLLMFSPTGKPSLCKSKHSIEEVIARFAHLTPQEKAKRKLESLEALKKMFKKLDHDVNIPQFLGPSSQTVEDLTNQSSLLQNQISQVHTRLSYWTNPDKLNSLQHLGHLENSLKESLDQIRLHKEHLGKQQLLSLECNRQLQSQMHLPFKFGVEQQFSPLPWIPRNENQPIALPEDPTVLPHRNAECSASSSFGSYSGLLGTGGSPELSNYCQESALNGLLHELSGTASLKLQLSEHFPCAPYTPNWLNETKFQPPAEMNMQQNSVPFQVNGNFEAPKFGYDTNSCGWTSTSELFPVTRFSEHMYARQPN